jgi:hypothetical protein
VPRTSFEPHLSRSGEDSNSFESQSQRDGRQLENPPRQTYDATSAAPATQSGSLWRSLGEVVDRNRRCIAAGLLGRGVEVTELRVGDAVRVDAQTFGIGGS